MRACELFISYSRVDRYIAAPISQLLRTTQCAVFRDEDSIQPGERWSAVITESLENCECVLVFWSAAAPDSKSVEAEFRQAIALNKRVVPVLIDDAPLPPFSEYAIRTLLQQIQRVMS
jgi:hypothetical protein